MATEPSIDHVPIKRKRRWTRVLFWVLTGLIVLLIGTGSWLYLQVTKPLPVIEGEVTLSSLENPVSVWRDAEGVPHIEALNDRDLYMAQGYVTAQDRLFQMDLSRRQASGMLSEVVGAAALERDQFFRTFGLRRAAEASVEMYSDEAKEALEAYAIGVNTFMNEAVENGELPVEFRILGYEPTEWTATDSLTIGKFMAFDLGGHWEGQAFRYYLAQNFTEEEALELFPSYPEDGALVIEELKAYELDITNKFVNAVIPDPFNGSNNWVLSGEKTESGMPLLADDPHLSLATPSIWYEAHLVSPEQNVNGVIFAGIPGIILGHNEDIAWGVTNVGPDVQDIYIERRHVDDPYLFEYMGEWEEATIHHETIKIKDEEDLAYEVVETRHGPIISEFAHNTNEEYALALRWTAHLPSPELEAVLKFNKASDWETFKDALESFHTPAQNFVFAATDGTIAYRANGLIPIRSKGDSSVPVPGWTGEYEWEGFIPWDELPTIVNPEEGFISTANNKIVDEDYPYHITHTWAQPFRQQRIIDVLKEGNSFTTDEMKNLQNDIHNLQAQEMLPILFEMMGEIDGESESVDEALMILRDWDYTDHKDLAAPLIFHLWMLAISDEMFTERIDESMMDLFDNRASAVDEILRRVSRGESSVWVDTQGGIETLLENSFYHTIERIIDLQGADTSDWNWGEFHSIEFAHPLSSVWPMNYLFNEKPTPVSGSRVTVMAAGWDAETGRVTHGAGWRGVMDLADLSVSYHVVGPGQSGNVRSPWYHNQIEDWTSAKYHKTLRIPEEYQANSKQLILTP
ncbi:penicillin acylase family protein [Bacillus sp. FJAT-45037]|uniref:penicillin acylase family protein n=1 Tax=Bacillus sp. FJAT-45037 TaxID=2011007 RepID=UPI001E341148|nr:penicillin acylase family protein [Bacillus sp. FJAT-45037]